MVSQEESKDCFDSARKVFPGGVNSPVRAFGSVGGSPLFIDHAEGAYVFDVDSNRYIDFVGSWGTAVLGHADPDVVQAVKDAAEKGLSFGAPTVQETKLAHLVQDFFPSMDRMRFVSSGTEACMSAIRLARGFTEREKILKFSGCYHGHADSLLVAAGSGAATLGIPGSAGVTAGSVKDTLTVRYNDLNGVKNAFKEHGKQIAAVIVEPIVGNSGFLRPHPGFLEGLREVSSEAGALLIFDEVMTGFRVAPGGVQSLVGVRPDLTTLGKVVGGGLPIGVYGGRPEVMARVAPDGDVYQAGTLSGNPLSIASGCATLEKLKGKKYQDLGDLTQKMISEFRQVSEELRIPFQADGEGGMFGFFFSDVALGCYEEVAEKHDARMFTKLFWEMLRGGCYLAPSPFEAGFVSFAHTEANIEQTIQVFANSLRKLV